MMHKTVFYLLLSIGAFFLFYNISAQYLWEDEAETAILAKSVLKEGVPKTFDGKNRIYLHIKDSLRSGDIWTFHPWLQFYLTAASFAISGKPTTFSARIPFALLGFLSLIALYILALTLFKDRSIALITLSLFVFSIPFILHMRQCRYYAPAVFFTLWFILSYINLIKNKKYSFLSFIVAGNFLFHSNYGTFLPVIFAFILHYFIFYYKKISSQKFIAALTILFVSTFPWFIYLKGYQHRGHINLHNLSHQIQFYFRITYKYMFPLLFFIIVFIVQLLRRKKRTLLSFYSSFPKDNMWLLLLIIISTFVFSLTGDQRFFRYILHILPLFLILEALLFREWFKDSQYFAPIAFILILFTNILHYSAPTLLISTLPSTTKQKLSALYPPGKLNRQLKETSFSPVYSYLYELTHSYKDPVEGMITFLLQHAKPTDTIAIPYDNHPLMFYTNFKVFHLRYEKEVFADWIVFQKGWFEEIYGNCEKSSFCQTILSNYEKFVIDYPDILWNNMPEPTYHKFKTVTDAPNLIIYKKIKN